jgi:hypothetical protein
MMAGWVFDRFRSDRLAFFAASALALVAAALLTRAHTPQVQTAANAA